MPLVSGHQLPTMLSEKEGRKAGTTGKGYNTNAFSISNAAWYVLMLFLKPFQKMW